jgi:hypothetical protein
MNGRELLERGLRRGVALWRLEEELDWRENQGSRRAEHDARPAPGMIRSDTAFHVPVVVAPAAQGPVRSRLHSPLGGVSVRS